VWKEGCANALDLPTGPVQPQDTEREPHLQLTWADVAVGTLGIVALIGCIVLLALGRDIPLWIATIPSSVLTYYIGAVRKA
jgi:hypothetical protein